MNSDEYPELASGKVKLTSEPETVHTLISTPHALRSSYKLTCNWIEQSASPHIQLNERHTTMRRVFIICNDVDGRKKQKKKRKKRIIVLHLGACFAVDCRWCVLGVWTRERSHKCPETAACPQSHTKECWITIITRETRTFLMNAIIILYKNNNKKLWLLSVF